MIDSFYHMTLNELEFHFWRENVKILSSFTQRYNGRHHVTLRMWFIDFLHGVISLPGATSCDKAVSYMEPGYDQ